MDVIMDDNYAAIQMNGGSLVAENVTFKGREGVVWSNLSVGNNGSSISLTDCNIENATTGVYAAAGNANLTNTTIRMNRAGKGLLVDSGVNSVTATGCTFDGLSRGIDISDPNVSLDNCNFKNCTYGGYIYTRS